MGLWSMSTTLSRCSNLHAAIRRWRGFGRLVELAVSNAEQSVVDQGRLAGAGDAGDTGHHSDGQIQVDVAQVVAARPFQFQPLASERVRSAGMAICLRPER